MTPPPKKLCKKKFSQKWQENWSNHFYIKLIFYIFNQIQPIQSTDHSHQTIKSFQVSFKEAVVCIRLEKKSANNLLTNVTIFHWKVRENNVRLLTRVITDYIEVVNWLMVYIKNIPIQASYFATSYLIRYILYFPKFPKKSKKYLRIWGIYLNFCPGDIVT